MIPQPGVTRYRIADLDIEGVPVWLHLGGVEVLGQIKITARGRRIYRRIVGRNKTEDLPRHAVPALWRPADPRTWPATLPAPALETPEQHAPPPVASGILEAAPAVDGWPYPGLRLGRGLEPPASIDEAEARLLRAIRTRWALEDDERYFRDYRLGYGHKSADWPGALLVNARIVHKMLEAAPTGKLGFLEAGDYSDIHVDRSALAPRPARWMPTPRDVTDDESDLIRRWLSPMDDEACHLFVRRASMPVYSFAQIADELRSTRERVKAHYRRAREALFYIARGA